MASVQERVIDIVAEQLGVDKDKITPETSFVNDLGADSLDTVELVMELEEEFDINIPDDAAEKIQTVGQAVEYIENTSLKVHETTRRRNRPGGGHLAELPSRRSLEAHSPAARAASTRSACSTPTQHKVEFGGDIYDWSTGDYVSAKEAKRIDRFTQFAMVAGIDAVNDSGLDFSRKTRSAAA